MKRRIRTAVSVWFLAMCVCSGPAWGATVIRVATTGDDANDGSDWTLAKLTVRAGVSAAVSGDQVWVAAGIYVERITLKAGVALYGGFAGNETDLSQRNWSVNKTVLDGDKAGSVVTSPFGAAMARIDGFTIRNGTGTGSSPDAVGGGIYCSRSSPTIANNTITGNAAGYGGGIYCTIASATIANNVIIGNSASSGGGIYSVSCSPTIVNNAIVGNAASTEGGGICSYGASSMTIANDTITGNVAPVGGGIFYSPGLTALSGITNTIVAFNSSGVYTAPVSGVVTPPAVKSDCVYGNTEYNYSWSPDPTGTDGNISVDPKIAGWQYGGWHIQPNSPCVNAGDDGLVQTGWSDLDGQARIQDGRVDIGADESDGTEPPAGPIVIVRVSSDGDDANEGATWAAPKQTVQAAINTAGLAGGEVWVKAGMYPEPITLPALVHLYGGFAGTEIARDQRDFRANVTVLDGQRASDAVTAQGIGHGLGTIDGFTIRNGSGSGIYCNAASPTIANNTITGNAGSGISCDQNSSPTIANNTISGNAGDGIGCGSSFAVIANNAISGNDGSGIYCFHSSPMIVNNTVTGNTSIYDAGIHCSSSSPTIVNTIVAFNSSGIVAGGTGSNPTLRNNCVYGSGTSNYSGLTDPTGTDGNISADPRFANGQYSGWHLRLGSPCLNAGDDAAVQTGWPDLDGQTRIQGIHVDIGADESDGAEPPASGPNVIVRVSLEGDDVNDGASWAMPKRTVQAAIDAAEGWGGDVWVKAGTYPQRITLRPYAHVYGGFSGAESVRDQRDSGANVTVLDGQKGGPVVTAMSPDYSLSTIDGFTIQNGEASSGGGINCVFGSATITNNTITQNTATSSSRAGGGGIYCSYRSAMITNNVIKGNTGSYYGGGIYCSSSSPTITDNTITGNTASEDGGGIYCVSSSPTIANNTITGNTASDYGGGIYCASSFATITNNTITGNTASWYGGGIYCTSASATIANNAITGNDAGSGGGLCFGNDASANVVDNAITGNTARNGAGIYCDPGSSPMILNNSITGNGGPHFASGGGIYCQGLGHPMIANNRIIGNGSATTGTSGGGIYCFFSSPTIANNTIAGNSARYGGGVSCYSSAATIANDTITGNAADYGGGIHCAFGSPTIVNTIIAFNSSGLYTGSSTTARYNCVYGNPAYNYSGIADPTGANGNLSVDPLFVRNPSDGGDGWGTGDNDDYGDLRLQAASPCIDAGDNTAVPADVSDLDGDGGVSEPLPFDLAGGRRFINDPARVDTGLGTAPIVDMGAYEFIPGDFDRDGDVELDDFAHFRSCFNGANRPAAQPDCGDADLDDDADVDLLDFAVFRTCFNGPNRTVRCP